MSDDRHESSKPPPPSSPIVPPRDDGWRPAETDDTPRAVAWRARRGLTVAREVRAEAEELRTAIKDLSANVGGLTGAVDGVKKLLRWALGIVGALALAGATREVWIWLSTLHH